MGLYKFRVPDYWALEPRQIRTVHVIGLDGVPKPCRIKQLEELLLISRNQNESGRTYISYPFAKFGELTVCTGTLPESDKPYDLVTELARGTLNRLRNQTSIWKEGGLAIPKAVDSLTSKAVDALCQSIVSTATERDRAAAESLDFAIESIFILCDHFGKEISEYRVSEPKIPDFWLAIPAPDNRNDSVSINIDQHFDLVTTSDLESVPTEKNIIVGPLFDASPMSSFSFEASDFDSRREVVIDRCREIADNLPESTSLIHAACGLNGFGHKDLAYRQQIQVTTDVLDSIENSNCRNPVLVSFDYPWCERFAWSVGGTHPLQIADDLMRTGASISFLGLDINLDYWPVGSVSRDPLQWIDLIDIWCQFGIPLILCVRVPNLQSMDVTATEIEFIDDSSRNVTLQASEQASASPSLTQLQPGTVENSIRENLTFEQRNRLVQTILPMAAARPGVHGIIWRNRTDNDDLRFPQAGLLDEFGQPKTLLGVVEQFRREVLTR